MATPLVDYSLASVDHHLYAHVDIYTRRRKQSVAHKYGRQFFGIDTKRIRTSLQDDIEDGYNLDWREILSFSKELYKLNFVRTKLSIARVKLALYTQANDGRHLVSPPRGVFQYCLSSLSTYSTWEADATDQISRRYKWMTQWC